MTCIAYDGATIAVDSRATSGNIISVVVKWRRWRGCLMFFCGTLHYGLALMDWYTKGAKPDDYPDIPDGERTTLVVAKNGKVYTYEGAYPILQVDGRCAWGSGREVALGAMACGKTAREAVEISGSVCCDVGPPYITFDL